MDIILFGMQGSGKGTQGKALAEHFNLKIFDLGGQLRSLIASGTPLGQKIKEPVEAGKLIDDDTIIEVVETFLRDAPATQPLLFDGIPRRVSQAQKLSELLAKNHRDAFAVNIRISEEEALKRLTLRRICSQCQGIYPASYKGDVCQHCGGQLITRKDDNPEAIKNRLELYKEETMPAIKTYYDRDRLIEVDGEQPIENVTKEMLEKVAYLFS